MSQYEKLSTDQLMETAVGYLLAGSTIPDDMFPYLKKAGITKVIEFDIQTRSTEAQATDATVSKRARKPRITF